jgi:murein tripeptide amidase MpaA
MGKLHRSHSKPLGSGIGSDRSRRAAQTSIPSLQTKWADGAVTGTTGSWDSAKSTSGIFVNSHFDSGNIEVLDITDPSAIKLRIHEDPFTEREKISHYMWFYFRISGVRDTQLTMSIENAGTASFPEAWPGYKAVVSYDRKHWARTETEYDEKSGHLVIKHTAKYDAMYVAYFAPYSFEMHQDLVARCQLDARVRMQLLGETLDGHDLDLLQIGTPGEGKRAVWVIARQHPGESMAEWFMQGFLDKLLDRHDGLSKEVLRKAVFYVVPCANPDGVWRGHLRTNAVGANLNREWAEPSLERSPEVHHIMRKMEETGVDFFADVHGDEELTYNFIAGNEGIPAWDERLEKLQHDFSAAYKRASPDFQNGRGYGIDEPGKADLSIASNAVGEKYKCLAFTLEMPFKDTEDRPDPEQGWSPERSMRFGAAFLQPLAEALDALR